MPLAEVTDVAQLLEAAMLVCFGLSWPLSIRKTLITRKVEGKSLAFMSIVFVGYCAGVAAKVVRARGGWPEPVTALYAVNIVLVAIDIGLYCRFRPRPGP